MKLSRALPATVRCILLILLSVSLCGPGKSQNNKSIAIYMGQKIQPYETMAGEIRKELKGYECRVVSLEGIGAVPPPKNGEVIITIGKDAYGKLLPIKGANPLIYTMVLFPDNSKLPHPPDVMGVAMIPSPGRQLQILRECVGINSVTIFVNPEINAQFVSDLDKLAPKDLEYSLKKISSERQFLNSLDENFPASDAILLIPEPTVLTEEGIKKLVRRSYEERKPIIGFAPMYLGLGAALSLSVSETITAKVVAKMVSGEPAQWDRADGLCYSRLCEMRISKSARERFSLRLDSSRFSQLGCEFKEEH